MTERNPSAAEQTHSVALSARRTTMLVLLALASFVVILNAAALPVPLPSIMEEFDATLDEITWVLAAFIVTFAVFLLPAARLGDIYGRRRLFLIGIAVVAVASLSCALAPTIGFLVCAQAVLGAGAAMVEPAIFATITTTIPPELQRRAFGVQSAGFFAGGALGPVLSGAVTTGLSWEFLFWLDTLVAVVVLVGAWRVLPDSHAERRPRRWGLSELACGAAGIAALMVALIEGPRVGWSSLTIVGAFVVAAVALALFVVTQARSRTPLVDLGLFRHRRFAVGNAVRAITEFASLGIFFALSHYLQVQLGYSALAAGSLLMVVIAATIITAPLAEKLTGRVDVRWLVLPGFLLVAGSTFWAAHVSTEADWTFFLAPLALFGAGIGALESPADAATRADLPSAASEAGWRVAYVTYLLGIGLGVAIVSAVWQSKLVATVDRTFPHGVPGVIGNPAVFADAVNTALLSCVAAAILGLAVSAFFSPNNL